MNTLSNFLTLDIEEWYHANYETVDLSKFQSNETNLETLVDNLIDICSEYNVKSTCFVLGSVAENKPQIVRKLFRAGHEIASHGYGHKLVYSMSAIDFKEDLSKSCNILQSITGENVYGYRAPSWSVKKENLAWFYAVLEEQELKYSSSVYPGKTFLYGIEGFHQYPHNPVVNGKETSIIEIPVPVCNILGKNIGFSGGFYLRLFPLWFVKMQFKKNIDEQKSAFIYLHPREIDKFQPKLKLSFAESFIHYYGIKECENKLRNILEYLKCEIHPRE